MKHRFIVATRIAFLTPGLIGCGPQTGPEQTTRVDACHPEEETWRSNCPAEQPICPREGNRTN
ncbi:MAG: hypothetical protein Q4P30_05335 [Eubacteriales bacterium]|nr:hypothetical protein [Eubacteriales bacterium]